MVLDSRCFSFASWHDVKLCQERALVCVFWAVLTLLLSVKFPLSYHKFHSIRESKKEQRKTPSLLGQGKISFIILSPGLKSTTSVTTLVLKALKRHKVERLDDTLDLLTLITMKIDMN